MRKDSKVLVIAAFLIIITAVSMLVTAACDHEPENTLPPVASGTVVITPDATIPTNVEPSIRGFITRITNTAEYTEIMVEYFPEDKDNPEYSIDKVLVKLDDKSAVAYGEDNEAYTRTSLSIGAEVEVWFTDPTAESYPAIAYGQAARVVGDPRSMTSIKNLPYLTVSGGSTCSTVVTEATWNGKTLDQPNIKTMLDSVSGAHLSAMAGDIITFKFSSEPDSITASWATATYSSGQTLEISENKAVVPEESKGEIFIRVNASWGENTVQYALSVTVPELQEQG